MLCVDSIDEIGREHIVRGWLFDGEKKLTSCRYETRRKRIALNGYGKPSPDLLDVFGEQAANCRFEFHIPDADPQGFIAFRFKGGAYEVIPLSKSREASGRIKVLKHQIARGRYYGKFVLPKGMKVSSVVLSAGTPYDRTFFSTKKKKCLLFNSKSKTLIIETQLEASWCPDDINLYFILKDSSILSLVDVGINARKAIRVLRVEEQFYEWLESKVEPVSVVEIGSRARSGVTRRGRIPNHHRYSGLDLKDGENVNVVGDAHLLSQYFEYGSIDAVFGYSVFEHLAMPWKVAIELNRIMRVGARAMFSTHQSWPLHDDPYDFWRFSKDSWRTIFNQSTGFKIMVAEIGDRARILPEVQTNHNFFPHDSFGYLISSVLIEKTGETELNWDVSPEDVYQGGYPA